MADEGLYDRIHDLTDLELAALLSLINREHCLISTPDHAVDGLVAELQLIATRTFGLSSVVVNCDAHTSLESFASAILEPSPRNATPGETPLSSDRRESYSYFSSNPRRNRQSLSSPAASAGSLRIANVIVARNLDRAPVAVQIQALELLRSRRIFTRTSVQAAPKQFLFIPVLSAESGGEARLTEHLNDFLFVAHWHDPELGFVNVEEERGEDEDGSDVGADDDTASTGSVVKRASPEESGSVVALFSESDIDHLARLSEAVEIDVDVIRYQLNIVSFLRMHRAVADGISPAATKHFDRLIRCLAPLHKLDYATPALVALAARKIYLHRIRITAPAKERSMQWGSRLEAVEVALADVGPEEVIEDVLELVTAPV